jgi:uncharacterized membrane protein YeaQ/YmgE (transglycosylase-associated protein family)
MVLEMLVMLVMSALMGLMAGGLAGLVLKGASHGPIGDIVLGLVGSVAAGSIFRILGIFPGSGRLAIAVVALVGAVGVLVVQRELWPPPVARPRPNAVRRRSVARQQK